MGDQQGRVVGARQLIDATGHDPQGIDVQAGIGLIEDRHHGIQQSHLQNLVALFLAAAEALVDGAIQEGGIHLHHLEALANEVLKGKGVELLVALLGAAGIGGHPQELQIAHAWDFDRVLETQEDPCARPLLGVQLQQVLAAVGDAAAGDGVGGVTRQHLGEGALAAAVAAHHRVDFAGTNRQVDALEDLLVLDASVEIPDLKQHWSVRANHGGRETKGNRERNGSGRTGAALSGGI